MRQRCYWIDTKETAIVFGTRCHPYATRTTFVSSKLRRDANGLLIFLANKGEYFGYLWFIFIHTKNRMSRRICPSASYSCLYNIKSIRMVMVPHNFRNFLQQYAYRLEWNIVHVAVTIAVGKFDIDIHERRYQSLGFSRSWLNVNACVVWYVKPNDRPDRDHPMRCGFGEHLHIAKTIPNKVKYTYSLRNGESHLSIRHL